MSRYRKLFPAVTVGGAAFELVRIPAGDFQMGSEKDGEKPRHRVQARGFDLGKAAKAHLLTEIVGAGRKRDSEPGDLMGRR